LCIEREGSVEGCGGSEAVNAWEECLSSEVLAREDGTAGESGGLAVGGSGICFCGGGDGVSEVFGAGVDTGRKACYGGAGGDAEVAVCGGEAGAGDGGGGEEGICACAAEIDGLGGGEDGVGEEVCEGRRGEHDRSWVGGDGAVLGFWGSGDWN